MRMLHTSVLGFPRISSGDWRQNMSRIRTVTSCACSTYCPEYEDYIKLAAPTAPVPDSDANNLTEQVAIEYNSVNIPTVKL